MQWCKNESFVVSILSGDPRAFLRRRDAAASKRLSRGEGRIRPRYQRRIRLLSQASAPMDAFDANFARLQKGELRHPQTDHCRGEWLRPQRGWVGEFRSSRPCYADLRRRVPGAQLLHGPRKAQFSCGVRRRSWLRMRPRALLVLATPTISCCPPANSPARKGWPWRGRAGHGSVQPLGRA